MAEVYWRVNTDFPLQRYSEDLKQQNENSTTKNALDIYLRKKSTYKD